MWHSKEKKGLLQLQYPLLWKLVFINFVMICMMILFVGVSVKDFACYLVAQTEGFDKGVTAAGFEQAMGIYLVKVSFITVLLAILLHFFLVQKVIEPIQRLIKSTKALNEGYIPHKLPVMSKDEVGMLTRQMNDLIEKLAESEARQQKLVMDVAHELRTPLSTINGYLEALNQGVVKAESELFHSLHEESLRLINLVEQLHQLSITYSKQEVDERYRCNIKQVVEDMVSLFSLQTRQKGITVFVDMENAWVIGETSRWKQVLQNLLQNAIQYHKEGRITIRGYNRGETYTVAVEGVGQWIPPEKQELLFERFYRMDDSRSRTTGGSGLGLSIVKEIVEMHGGKAGLTSDGHFHSFWFTIPLA